MTATSVDAVITDPPYAIRRIPTVNSGALHCHARTAPTTNAALPGPVATACAPSRSTPPSRGLCGVSRRRTCTRAMLTRVGTPQTNRSLWRLVQAKADRMPPGLQAQRSTRRVRWHPHLAPSRSNRRGPGLEIRASLAWHHASGVPTYLNAGRPSGQRPRHRTRTLGGRGTGLMPAYEPIVLARCALRSTIVSNIA